MTIKELYHRFRQWQENPMTYQKSQAAHHCLNCGEDYQGNYCPTCGQSADTGPVSWRNLRQEWMGLWGLGTRSLPYTIIQLLLRPGYLMREYISGKRRNCYSPLGMLVLVAVVVTLIDHWLDLDYTPQANAEQATDALLYTQVFVWLAEHKHIAVLLTYLLTLVPTYIVFRYAPRYPRHTLPQGFFIQVFNATQYLCLLIPLGLLYKMLILYQADIISVEDYHSYKMALLPILLFFNYRQLFGYGVWGTLWRTISCFLIWFLTFIIVLCLVMLVYFSLLHAEIPLNEEEWSPQFAINVSLLLAGSIISILCIIVLINRRGKKKMTNDSI